MPIGKNSLKRVTNNGYSAVKTAAPDMENSTVVTEPTPVAETKPATPKAETKPAAKKATAPKATAEKKPATKTTAKKPTAKAEPKPEPKKAEPKTAAKKPTTAAKKPTAKAETKPAAKPENKIPHAPETASRIIARAEDEKGYCNLGDELPVHLL